jgi:hypothetical protein
VDPDFVILLLKIADWEWMNPHVKNSERNSIAFEEENEDIVGTGLAIMQIYDQEKRREIQD